MSFGARVSFGVGGQAAPDWLYGLLHAAPTFLIASLLHSVLPGHRWRKTVRRPPSRVQPDSKFDCDGSTTMSIQSQIHFPLGAIQENSGRHVIRRPGWGLLGVPYVHIDLPLEVRKMRLVEQP